MNRDDDPGAWIRAHEDMMAAADSIESPSLALQNPDQLLRPDGRQAIAHIPTVTRPNSIGAVGTDSPWAASDSR